MSAAPAVVPAAVPWSPYRGQCWKCKAGYAWSVPLHAISLVCYPCHDKEQAEYLARRADAIKAALDYELTRLEHIETCRWCAKWNDEHGRIPPAYRCPGIPRAAA